MIISRIITKNWRNFQFVDVRLGYRAFLVGPNASGKSNFLDVFRFLKDLSKPYGGGLQKAVIDRGGLPKIRCLAAKGTRGQKGKTITVEIEVHLAQSPDAEPTWRYEIGITQETSGNRLLLVEHERVWNENGQILSRPSEDDIKDKSNLEQTYLEQKKANASFREIADFFNSIKYFHLVPQLIRYPEYFIGPTLEEDPFGKGFLERIAKTRKDVRESRLKIIEKALRNTVPQLQQLRDRKDDNNINHLEAIYEHWRPRGARQNEKQFSDGTLRLISFLWSVLESESILLLEEPELSLHSSIIRQLPGIIWRIQNKKKKQTIISTHSIDLLSDPGIGREEVLVLTPHKEGTRIETASSFEEVVNLMEGGMTLGEAVAPITEPKHVSQLSLFDE